MEAGCRGEVDEGYGRSDFVSGDDVAATEIRQAWRERGKVGGGGGSWTAKDRGEAGNIGMLGLRQVTPRWEDDHVRRHNGSWWRGCWGVGIYCPFIPD